MGIDTKRIGVQIRRSFVISFRTCYRSVCRHPALFCMVCFLIFLYRSFPFLFSLLVSASPVLVCTAVLLGTLLSFGEPNIPEIEKEKEEEVVTHEISSLKAGVIEGDTVVCKRDESLCLESFMGDRRDKMMNDIEKDSLEDRKGHETNEDALCDYMRLIDETSQEVQFEKQVIDEQDREFEGLEVKRREVQKDELGIEEVPSHGGVVENQDTSIQTEKDENFGMEDDKRQGAFTEAQRGDHANFSMDSSLRWAINGDEDDEASDSGSDRAESSSPDASMADIIPMLDELHPLLDEEAPQPARMSHHGSDAGSEHSHSSKESSIESEEDMENQEDEEEVGDDDNDNEEEEEEEEAQGGKEDESKSAIKWTADDQKNLMDLGTLELERNQRLESLIARRRARRNVRSVAEKNLIDLDGADLPFNIPPISTARRNPFDLPYDALCDVPGSAPSILLPRRNPFDLPYDSSEEKPDLKEDSFQQEFSRFQHKESIFRRHESFSAGPSVLGGLKQERQELGWKPYFIPERFATEGTSYPTFQRQISEVSESKVSSIPDTESVSSAVEDEDKKLNEEDNSQEAEMFSNLDQASLLVERGSLSSEDDDYANAGKDANRNVHHGNAEITLGDAENNHETDSSLSASGVATPVELNTSEVLLRMGTGGEEYSSRSSLSSLSEVDEKISDEREGLTIPSRSEQMEESHIATQISLDSDFHFMSGVVDDEEHREPLLEPTNNHMEDLTILSKTPLESGFHFTNTTVDNNPHKVPVYDSSPTSDEKSRSPLSVSSDLQGETSGMGLPPVTEYANEEFEMHTASMERDISDYKRMHESSSQFQTLDENGSRSREVTEIRDRDMMEVGAEFDGQNGLFKSKVGEHVPFDFPASSSDNGSVKEGASFREKNSHHQQDQLHSSSLSAQTVVMSQQDAVEKLDSASSEETTLSLVVENAEPEEEHVRAVTEAHQLEQEQVHPSSSVVPEVHVNGHQGGDPHVHMSFAEAENTQKLPLVEEEPQQSAENQVHPSNSTTITGADQDVDLKVVSSGSNYQDVPSEENSPSPFVSEKQLTWSDKSMIEPSLNDHDEPLEPSASMAESMEEVISANNVNEREAHYPEDKMPRNITSLMSDSTPNSPVSSEYKSPINGVDLEESMEEVIANDVNERETNDPDEKMLRNITSLTSHSTPVSSVNPEYKSPVGGVDLKDNFLDKIVYEDGGNALDLSTSSIESKINKEDEIKEIDEGLLSELDRVGDFSVKEVVGESLQHEQIPENATDDSHEVHLLPKDTNLPINKSELPVLEVRSVEDVNLAFKQLCEGADVDDVILPRMIENQLVNESELLVIEASSLEDIDSGMKQVSKGNVEEVGSTKELPVLELRTTEDIDLAFKQLHEGADIEEVLLPSMIESYPEQSSSDLLVVEARSPEDIQNALRHASKSNIEELPKLSLSDPKDKPEEGNEEGDSTKDVESSTTKSGIQETGTSAPHEQSMHEFHEANKLNTSDAEGKKTESDSSSSSDSD